MIVPKVPTHSRAAMPSRHQHTNNPKDMPYRTVATTMSEDIWSLTQEVPGYPLPLSLQSRGVTFSMLLPAPPIPNSKIAGPCTLLIHNLEWQSHQLSIPNHKTLTTAVVVRTITSHLLGFYFPFEDFLTYQRFLLQVPTKPRIHMVNEYTKTALPGVKFQ